MQAQVKGLPVLLMTSHLESTKDHGTERKKQLGTAWKEMKNADANRTVIFGGDLNLRDKEVCVYIMRSSIAIIAYLARGLSSSTMYDHPSVHLSPSINVINVK